MFNRRNLIQHACPTCTTEYWYLAERAGSDTTCRKCNSTYPVPTGLTPRLVSVGGPPDEEELRPQEAVVVRKTVPVRMILPKGLGGLDVVVSQDTANSLAKTFLGGLLVAIGVALAAMIGIRKRS